ncbi:pro-apoptotic serine protease nma111-like protein [Phytophthora cinnamomi]|uniref:pro-apoptotic serine protease nma111-like protein n=1 Tax=Phytophthora cinnamomi TaxID=4785 RepID=UPI0035599846|nr:pro-apoptotic serine protease nma111-like protein [Phytophthora cinnamomi]
MWKAGARAAAAPLRRSPTSWRPAANAQLLSRRPRALQVLSSSGLGGVARPFSTSSSSAPTTQNAQMAAAALVAAGVGYLFVSTERQSDQEKQQRELEIQKERKLSDRLAAELVAAEANQNKLDWKATLERVVPAIVSLKLNSPKFFDTESPGNGSATGFVVDAEKGIILTNRHVVGPGPIDAEAVFQNNEEVRVIPIYRDPDVKHMSVPSLRLEPDKATVGTDIRVVGNDAAEKLAIASGTLARLDRDSPNYGYNNYNDFNTFYYQASSGTTGGSSGSPVLNHDGDAIALNAGGKIGTSASFYLPLDRVKRAFDLIREGKDTPQRKDLFAPPPRWRQAILDDNVGEEIELQIERSGELVTHKVQVQDLHSVTPSRFIEIGGAVINPLSYQQARNHAMSPGAPYVADPGYFLQRSRIGRGAIIHSVNGIKTPDLKTLKNYLRQCKDRDRIVVKFSKLTDKSEKVEVVHVDRRWFPFCEYVRDDKLGTWHCEHFVPPSESAGGNVQSSGQKEPIGSTTTLPGKNPVENKLARSLVTVDFDRPFSVNSLSTSNYRGTGLVIDAEKGLVVVDRNTVTDSMGDAMVTFASTIMVPAYVVFVHPVHNFAIVQYDPKLIGSTPIESCQVASKPLVPSDPVWLVGLMSSVGRSGHSDLVSRETIVSGVKWIGLPMPNPPRYQEHNLEMVALQDVVGTEGGVVCSDKGEVSAFWASFSFQQQRRSSKVESQFNRGIPMELIMESAAPLMRGVTPKIYDLGVDFEHLSLAKARELGLGQALAEILEKDAPDRRTILSVARRWGGTEAQDVLKNGDILVAVDGKIVTSFREVERCTQKPEVQLTIVRDGREMQLDVKTLFMERTEINRIVFWQGLLLQAPPLSVSAQRSISLEDGIYVSCRYSGSPAARYGPPPTSRIKEIDGIKISSIDDFLRVVTAKSENDSVRIKYTDLSGKDRLSTLKLEPKYWPTSELVNEGGEWHRHQH